MNGSGYAMMQGNGRSTAWYQNGSGPVSLPGYFTFHVLKDAKLAGMLSVNEQTEGP